MANITRNEPMGFARFGWKNFEFIEQAAKANPELHPVTQLALSLLGLIVFQHERKTLENSPGVRDLQIADLDWARWRMSPAIDRLEELVTNLRHAVAHGHITFSSSSHNLDEVEISFSNPGRKGGPWTGTIRADALRTFCTHFLALLEQTA